MRVCLRPIKYIRQLYHLKLFLLCEFTTRRWWHWLPCVTPSPPDLDKYAIGFERGHALAECQAFDLTETKTVFVWLNADPAQCRTFIIRKARFNASSSIF